MKALGSYTPQLSHSWGRDTTAVTPQPQPHLRSWHHSLCHSCGHATTASVTTVVVPPQPQLHTKQIVC